MTDLSYDALTVANAFLSTPITPDLQQSELHALGAALRAAASQLTSSKAIDQLRAIATELESQ